MRKEKPEAYLPRPPRVWSGMTPRELAAHIREILKAGRMPPRYLLWEAISVIDRLVHERDDSE